MECNSSSDMAFPFVEIKTEVEENVEYYNNTQQQKQTHENDEYLDDTRPENFNEDSEYFDDTQPEQIYNLKVEENETKVKNEKYNQFDSFYKVYDRIQIAQNFEKPIVNKSSNLTTSGKSVQNGNFAQLYNCNQCNKGFMAHISLKKHVE